MRAVGNYEVSARICPIWLLLALCAQSNAFPSLPRSQANIPLLQCSTCALALCSPHLSLTPLGVISHGVMLCGAGTAASNTQAGQKSSSSRGFSDSSPSSATPSAGSAPRDGPVPSTSPSPVAAKGEFASQPQMADLPKHGKPNPESVTAAPPKVNINMCLFRPLDRRHIDRGFSQLPTATWINQLIMLQHRLDPSAFHVLIHSPIHLAFHCSCQKIIDKCSCTLKPMLSAERPRHCYPQLKVLRGICSCGRCCCGCGGLW